MHEKIDDVFQPSGYVGRNVAPLGETVEVDPLLVAGELVPEIRLPGHMTEIFPHLDGRRKSHGSEPQTPGLREGLRRERNGEITPRGMRRNGRGGPSGRGSSASDGPSRP